jgi:predicted ATPase
VRAISCREIAREIERNLDFLATTLRDLPERHRSLRAVFDHSWNRLNGEEQRIFRNLSVFRGGFQREAAEAVAEASLLVLSALMDKSLLRRNPSGRYEVH